MKIYVGCDHNGFELKRQIKDYLERLGHDVVDEGDDKIDPEDDYPIFAARVVTKMLSGGEPEPRGILICGSGQGMCIAANRFKGIRACLCWNSAEAHAARNDDNSNVLCLSARLFNIEEAENITSVWLSTPFAGATRFIRRIKDLDELT